jgi:MYXO-CTERM domain-containing protein
MVCPGETLGSLAIGVVAMGTTPSPREAAGAGLVVVGAVLAIRR